MSDQSDIREQLNDPEELLRTAIDSVLAGKFGSLPVMAVEDSKDGNTVKLKVLTKIPVQGPDGKTQWKELPEIEDVVAQHPGAGGITNTFPIKKGDVGTVSFQSKGISNWHESGGVQNATLARNSLSDGIFRMGSRAKPDKLKGVSKDSVQTRTDDKKSVHDVSHTAVSSVREDAAHQVNGQAVQSEKGGSKHVVDASTIQNTAGKILLNC